MGAVLPPLFLAASVGRGYTTSRGLWAAIWRLSLRWRPDAGSTYVTVTLQVAPALFARTANEAQESYLGLWPRSVEKVHTHEDDFFHSAPLSSSPEMLST